MRYWDASAIVPLILEEPRSRDARERLAADPEILTWWGTRVECRSALYRLLHQGRITTSVATRAEAVLRPLAARWLEVGATEVVRETAERLLRSHVLRAGDALQLAAAIVAADHRPSGLEFVCFDDRLTEAARREGFPVT